MKKIVFAILILLCFILSIKGCNNSQFQEIEDVIITQNAEITTTEENKDVSTESEKTYGDYLSMLKEAEENAINSIKEAAEPIENYSEKLTFEEKSIFLYWCEEYTKIYTLLSQKLPIEEIWDMYNDNELGIELWKPSELINMEIDDWYKYKSVHSSLKQSTIILVQIYYDAEYNEYNIKTHNILHEKDSTSYTMVITDNSASYPGALPVVFTLRLFDMHDNLLQTLELISAIGGGFDYIDINSDGYKDMIWFHIAGTSAGDMQILYVWDVASQNFVEVIDENGEGVWIHYYKINGEYITLGFRMGMGIYVERTYLWNGNTLILQSEETINYLEQEKGSS